MCTVSVKAGQIELNEARVTNEQRNKQGNNERTHQVSFLNLYVDGIACCMVMLGESRQGRMPDSIRERKDVTVVI